MSRPQRVPISTTSAAARAFADALALPAKRHYAMTACKEVLRDHVVYSVLLDGCGDFELVLPIVPAFQLLFANKQLDVEVVEPEALRAALRDLDVPLFFAIAYGLVHYASLSEKLRAQLFEIGGGNESRLQLVRKLASDYLWGLYRGC